MSSLLNAGSYASEMREQMGERNRRIIDKLVNAETMAEVVPWHEAMFQQQVVRALQNAKRFEKDAQKLAVIKEVFGGKS